jgi:hypothetical protein
MTKKEERKAYDKLGEILTKALDKAHTQVYSKDGNHKTIRKDSICYTYDKEGNKKYYF